MVIAVEGVAMVDSTQMLVVQPVTMRCLMCAAWRSSSSSVR